MINNTVFVHMHQCVITLLTDTLYMQACIIHCRFRIIKYMYMCVSTVLQSAAINAFKCNSTQ